MLKSCFQNWLIKIKNIYFIFINKLDLTLVNIRCKANFKSLTIHVP